MTESGLKTLICKYSSVCDGNCLKCKYLLKELKIIEISEIDEKEDNPFPSI